MLVRCHRPKWVHTWFQQKNRTQRPTRANRGIYTLLFCGGEEVEDPAGLPVDVPASLYCTELPLVVLLDEKTRDEEAVGCNLQGIHKKYKKRLVWIEAGRITDEVFYVGEKASGVKKKCARGIISLEKFQR